MSDHRLTWFTCKYYSCFPSPNSRRFSAKWSIRRSFPMEVLSYSSLLRQASCFLFYVKQNFPCSGKLFIVVQFLSYAWLFVIPWSAAHQASLSFTISLSLLKLMSTESVMPSNHLILCHPFLLLLPSVFFPASVSFPVSRLFTIRWPKCWSFSFRSVLQMNIQGWFPLGLIGLISFTVQGTLKSLL